MAAGLKKLLGIRASCPVVKRSSRTYLVTQGWAYTGGTSPHWEGLYKTPQATFRGWIEAASRPRYLIYQPPQALTRQYPANITSQGQGWYTVSFCTQPKDVDSGVLEIERLLRIALSEAAKA